MPTDHRHLGDDKHEEQRNLLHRQRAQARGCDAVDRRFVHEARAMGTSWDSVPVHR
jgi:hypothetical protein